MKKVRFGYLAYQTKPNVVWLSKNVSLHCKMPPGGGGSSLKHISSTTSLLCALHLLSTHYLIMTKKLNALFSETPCIYDFKVIKQHKQWNITKVWLEYNKIYKGLDTLCVLKEITKYLRLIEAAVRTRKIKNRKTTFRLKLWFYIVQCTSETAIVLLHKLFQFIKNFSSYYLLLLAL